MLDHIGQIPVIRLLRSKGHVVGFVGDGINDAPALWSASWPLTLATLSVIAFGLPALFPFSARFGSGTSANALLADSHACHDLVNRQRVSLLS